MMFAKWMRSIVNDVFTIQRAKPWILAVACLCSAVAVPAFGATYTASSTTYVWETSANVLANANFAQTCTPTVLTDDEATINFTGGFVFPFYGVNYTSARMFSNGQIQFGADTGAFRSKTPTALPEGSSSLYTGCPGGLPTTNVLSVGWLDLTPQTAGGTMSYEFKGVSPNQYGVFTWTNVKTLQGGGYRVTMQAILNQDGTIKVQYQSINSGVVPTVGVQASVTDYTQWGTTPTNSSAILFSPALLSSFSVTPASSSASTCGSTTTTVKALTVSGATYVGYTGTVSLSTSTGHGTWALSSGSGTFIAGAADSGSASYTYSAADMGVAVFSLLDPHAESLTEMAASGLSSGTSTAVTFSKNAFVLAPTDPLGFETVAGRPHAFSASFYKQDPSTGVCSVASGYTGTKALDMWYVPSASHPASALAPSYSASSTCSGAVSLPSSAPAVSAASNNISMAFSSGSATFYLCSSDVGQFALNLRDDTLGFSSSPVTGSAGLSTVRPFGLWIDTVAVGALANPGGTASTGAKFTSAESFFSARVGAKLWASGQDTAKAGTPDAGANLASNGATPAFSAPVMLSVSSKTPAAGATGALLGGSVAASSFAGGFATDSVLQYSEAGSVALTASSASYLSSGYAIPGVTTGQIGRFYPASIAMATSSLSPACAAGGFTYMDQPLALSTQLKALGASGGLLTNYDAALGYGFLLSPAWRAVDSSNGVDLGSRVATGTAPSWSGGVWTYSNPAAVFARLATGPDGQYDALRLGLSGTDADGVSIASMDINYSVAGACSGAGCNAKSVGGQTRVRHGRLALANAFGSILTNLKVPVAAQYWSKSAGGAGLGWASNTLDSCTVVPASALSVGLYSGGVSSVSLQSTPVSISAGSAVITATRTGNAAVGGTAIVGVDLGSTPAYVAGCAAGIPAAASGANLPHLRSNFCSSSNYGLNPSAKLVWGSSNSKSNSVVFIRETY